MLQSAQFGIGQQGRLGVNPGTYSLTSTTSGHTRLVKLANSCRVWFVHGQHTLTGHARHREYFQGCTHLIRPYTAADNRVSG
jgi:hypothetical protein